MWVDLWNVIFSSIKTQGRISNYNQTKLNLLFENTNFCDKSEKKIWKARVQLKETQESINLYVQGRDR